MTLPVPSGAQNSPFFVTMYYPTLNPSSPVTSYLRLQRKTTNGLGTFMALPKILFSHLTLAKTPVCDERFVPKQQNKTKQNKISLSLSLSLSLSFFLFLFVAVCLPVFVFVYLCISRSAIPLFRCYLVSKIFCYCFHLHRPFHTHTHTHTHTFFLCLSV